MLPNPVQQQLGSPPAIDLESQVAAIVRANRGKVNYRQLVMLTGWDRQALRRVIARCRDMGMIPPTTNRRNR